MTFTVQDGERQRGIKGLNDAVELAKQWSVDSGNVVSVMNGTHTYMYIYDGDEISGKVANSIWMDQEYATAQ